MAPPRARVVGGRLSVVTGSAGGHRWDTDRRPDVVRVTGRRLQAMRRALFMRQPLCGPCEAAGRTTLATIRDHIVPLGEGGTEDTSNEQAICRACHDQKTQAESRRGRGGQ